MAPIYSVVLAREVTEVYGAAVRAATEEEAYTQAQELALDDSDGWAVSDADEIQWVACIEVEDTYPSADEGDYLL